jgi:hypothetical protein
LFPITQFKPNQRRNLICKKITVHHKKKDIVSLFCAVIGDMMYNILQKKDMSGV